MTDNAMMYRSKYFGPVVEISRAVPPDHARGGVVSRQAFGPTQDEDYKLSVDDPNICHPSETKARRERERGRPIAGIWMVSRVDFRQLDGRDIVDPLPENPAHTLLDYSHLSRGQRRDVARRVAAFANGCVWSRV